MKDLTRFSKKVCDALQCYVYAYFDPRDGKPFYIGQGCGNRVFSHLHETSDKEKVQRIDALKDLGLQPGIYILRHGLTAEEAKLVESVAIDLLGVDNLTNIVRGHHSRKFGKRSIEEIVRIYDADEVTITEPAVLIRINKVYRPDMTRRELYEMTRSCWRVGPDREKAEYAMAVFDGVILEVYRIEAWLPGGSTFGDDCHGERDLDALKDRFEFVGRIAHEVRDKYIGKSVRHIWSLGAQNPVRYVNVRGS